MYSYSIGPRSWGKTERCKKGAVPKVNRGSPFAI
jgi:hypothetical protein